jgi:hypothetical protein
LRSLRLFLALEPDRTALGEIVLDAIENQYIPELEKRLEREPDEGKKRKLERLIDVWEKYGKRNTTQGRSWAKEAAAIVASICRKAFKNNVESITEDIASDVTSLFYTRPASRAKFMNFDPEDGPSELMKMFKIEVRDHTKDSIRTVWKDLQHQRLDAPPEEGGIGDPEDTREDELELYELRDLWDNMSKWVSRHLRDKKTKSFFNIWSKQIREKGGFHNVNLVKDVLPTWKEANGITTKWGNMAGHVKKIRQLMAKYLMEVEKKKLNKQTLKNIGLTARVAETYWKPRLAAWLLEVYRARRQITRN